MKYIILFLTNVIISFIILADCPGSINFGETISCSIVNAGEMDTFTFEALKGDVILVRMSTTSGNLWPGIRIYSPKGEKICEKESIPATSEIPDCNIPSDGTYSIKCYDSFGGTFTGNYNLYIQRLNNPGKTNNINFEQTVSSEIQYAAQMGSFKFNASSNDIVLVRMSTTSGNLWPGIRIYSPKGEKICEKESIPATSEIPNCSLNENGSYLILCYDSFGGTFTGSYNVYLSCLNPPCNTTCNLSCSANVPVSAEIGSSVKFIAEANYQNCTGYPKFLWDFGDGITSIEQNPVHIYQNVGTYFWKLEVTIEDQKCIKSGNISILDNCVYEISPPSRDFEASGGEGVINLSTSNNCFWDAFADENWITILNSNGKGSASISYSVKENLEENSRQGIIYIKDKKHFVNQAGLNSLKVEVNVDKCIGSAPLSVSFNANVSGGAPPYSFNWNISNGYYSELQNFTFIFSNPGKYDWQLRVKDSYNRIDEKNGSVIVFASEPVLNFLPAAANTIGTSDSRWKTDIMILNPNNEKDVYAILFTEMDKDGSKNFYPYVDFLEGKNAIFYRDALSSLYNLNNVAGNIRIMSNFGLFITSRTYNDQGKNGTYGQFIPSFSTDEALNTTEIAYILGLNQNNEFRSNLGFSEASGLNTKIDITLFNKNGQKIGQNEVELKPYSWKQYRLTDLGYNGLYDCYAKVQIKSGGKIFSYASVIDNKTNDAIFIPMTKGVKIVNQKHLLIPVIAKAPGAYNSLWRSDVWLLNPYSSQNLKLRYITNYGAYEANFKIEANQLKDFKDIIASLFPSAGDSTYGSLHIYSDLGIVAISRTFNYSSQGTFGQFINSVPQNYMLNNNSKGYLLHLNNNSNYRCNIGISEYDGNYALIKIDLYDQNGNLLKSKNSPVVLPYGNWQVDLFQYMGLSGSYENCYSILEIVQGTNVFPYASCIDKVTNDAIFIPVILK